MKPRLIITTALLLFVLIFAVQNTKIVEIQLLFWQVEFPRSLLIFMMLLIGIVIGWASRTVVKLSN